jgi:hypothetical protein
MQSQKSGREGMTMTGGGGVGGVETQKTGKIRRHCRFYKNRKQTDMSRYK